MEKSNKLTKKKKIIISCSVILGVIIIIGSIVLGMFCPRKLSTYIGLLPEDVDKIYISYYVPYEENKSVYLDKDKTEKFFSCIENIKIVPEYINYKVAEPYELCIVGGEKTYKLNGLGINIYNGNGLVKSKNYYVYSGNLGYVISLFDIPEADLKYI